MAYPTVIYNIEFSGADNGTTNLTALDLPDVDIYYSELPIAAITLVILSLFAGLLCLPTLAWYIKHRNKPAALMVAWIVLFNMANVINALIWPNDNMDSWPLGVGYCDLHVKLDLAGQMGILGALTCVMRGLAEALDGRTVRLAPSPSQRLRKAFIETFFCAVLPVYIMVAHFVVQPNRYYILAIAGCTPSFSDTWLSFLLVHCLPPAVCVVAAWHAVLVVIRIFRYCSEFAAVLAARGSGLSKSRYLRIFINAGILLLVFLPLDIYLLAVNASYPIGAFSWDAVHDPATWNSIQLVPTYGMVWQDRWVRPVAGFTVFACFGLGNEAMALYRTWLLWVGLGTIFPGLDRTNGGGSSSPPSGSNTVVGSQASSRISAIKAKLRFFRGAKDASKGASSLGSLTDSEPSPLKAGFYSSTSPSTYSPSTPATPSYPLNHLTSNSHLTSSSLHSSNDLHSANSHSTVRTHHTASTRHTANTHLTLQDAMASPVQASFSKRVLQRLNPSSHRGRNHTAVHSSTDHSASDATKPTSTGSHEAVIASHDHKAPEKHIVAQQPTESPRPSSTPKSKPSSKSAPKPKFVSSQEAMAAAEKEKRFEGHVLGSLVF